MIQPGEVRGVRELKRGLQAQVCLGADPVLGSAVITHTTTSPKVLAALDALKVAIREETSALLRAQLEGQAAWDKERGIA